MKYYKFKKYYIIISNIIDDNNSNMPGLTLQLPSNSVGVIL